MAQSSSALTHLRTAIAGFPALPPAVPASPEAVPPPPIPLSLDPRADSPPDSISITQHPAAVSSNGFFAHRRGGSASCRIRGPSPPRRYAKNALRYRTPVRPLRQPQRARRRDGSTVSRCRGRVLGQFGVRCRTCLIQDLMLKLESKKSPLDTIVVDHSAIAVSKLSKPPAPPSVRKFAGYALFRDRRQEDPAARHPEEKVPPPTH